jgi:DNA-binding Lrp family transcriptional regulator
MAKKDESAYIEDQDQIDALEEFAPKIREILRGFRDKRQLSAIAQKLGFHQSRLTEMITKNESGEYKKRITPYYLARFIDSGVIDARQLLAGRNIDDLPNRARIFFKRMILPPKTLELVIEAQRKGIDVDKLLETILYPPKVGKRQRQN